MKSNIWQSSLHSAWIMTLSFNLLTYTLSDKVKTVGIWILYVYKKTLRLNTENVNAETIKHKWQILLALSTLILNNINYRMWNGEFMWNKAELYLFLLKSIYAFGRVKPPRCFSVHENSS